MIHLHISFIICIVALPTDDRETTETRARDKISKNRTYENEFRPNICTFGFFVVTLQPKVAKT